MVARPAMPEVGKIAPVQDDGREHRLRPATYNPKSSLANCLRPLMGHGEYPARRPPSAMGALPPELAELPSDRRAATASGSQDA